MALARKVISCSKVACGVSRVSPEISPIFSNGFFSGNTPGFAREIVFHALRAVFIAWLARGSPLDLLAVPLFVEQLREQIIDERGVEAGDVPRAKAPTILQQVVGDHTDAGLVHTALTGA